MATCKILRRPKADSVQKFAAVLALSASLGAWGCHSPKIVRNLGTEGLPSASSSPLPLVDAVAYGLGPATAGPACERIRNSSSEGIIGQDAFRLVNGEFMVVVNAALGQVGVERFEPSTRAFASEKLYTLTNLGQDQVLALKQLLPGSRRPGVLTVEPLAQTLKVSLLELGTQGHSVVNRHEIPVDMDADRGNARVLTIFQPNDATILLSVSQGNSSTAFWSLSTTASQSPLVPTRLARHPSAGPFEIIGAGAEESTPTAAESSEPAAVTAAPRISWLLVKENSQDELSRIWYVGAEDPSRSAEETKRPLLILEAPLLTAAVDTSTSAATSAPGSDEGPQLLVSLRKSGLQAYHPLFSQVAVGGLWSVNLAINLENGNQRETPLPRSESPSEVLSSASWRRLSAIEATAFFRRNTQWIAWLQEPLDTSGPLLPASDKPESDEDAPTWRGPRIAHRFFALGERVGEQTEQGQACTGPWIDTFDVLAGVGHVGTAVDGSLYVLHHE